MITVHILMLVYLRDLNLGLSWLGHGNLKWHGAHLNGLQL